ncbi:MULTISPECIES: lasso RiPP family leader peptide-containing protein [Saccharopolyspora]|uniref:Lasso RiPP family leader peptide-containing protein n=1 Tax=Saccharopolyspora cebuensis TaxID=418759 RepID=A0ABV4CKH9_9PSEU
MTETTYRTPELAELGEFTADTLGGSGEYVDGNGYFLP